VIRYEELRTALQGAAGSAGEPGGEPAGVGPERSPVAAQEEVDGRRSRRSNARRSDRSS